MKKILCLFLACILSVAVIGCQQDIDDETTATSTPEETTENSTLEETTTSPRPQLYASYVFGLHELDSFDQSTVGLFENGQFSFIFNGLSSYIGLGEYTIEGDTLLLETFDDNRLYTFTIVEDGIIFDAENSDYTWTGLFEDGDKFDRLQ